MPPPSTPPRPRLRKREIALALGAGALASFAAAGILSDGFGGPGSSFERNEITVENEDTERTYQVANFDRISSSGPQDMEVSYGESFSVRSEGPIGQLEVSVVDGELVIGPRGGFGPGWERLQSTKFFVTLPRLNRLSLTGSGDVHVEQLKGERFVGVINGGFGGSFEIDALEVDEAEFVIDGLGEIATSGTARSTRVNINGAGEFQAGDLRSQLAVIAVRGAGDVELAVEQEADVTIEGMGEVDIAGPARCTVSTSGPGRLSCGDQD